MAFCSAEVRDSVTGESLGASAAWVNGFRMDGVILFLRRPGTLENRNLL
jgi:hypothetical protein